MGRRERLIVLDTHVLLWIAVAPKKLSAAAVGAIEMDGAPGISTITAQEISYLVMKERISLDRPSSAWIADVLAEHEIDPIEPAVSTAVLAGSLDRDFPGDPADRLIYATALERGVRLVSADERLRAVDPARVVW